MDAIDKLHLLAELGTSFCELNHGPGTEKLQYPASDFIIIPVGYQESETTDIARRQLVIPVCYECALALIQDEWTLIYCLECASNRWLLREVAKNSYRHHILWLRGCPDCSNEFGGLYFNDMPQIPAPAGAGLSSPALHGKSCGS